VKPDRSKIYILSRSCAEIFHLSPQLDQGDLLKNFSNFSLLAKRRTFYNRTESWTNNEGNVTERRKGEIIQLLQSVKLRIL
jgi:hypothetical protein